MSEAKASTYTTEQISAMDGVEFCRFMESFTKPELVLLLQMARIHSPEAITYALDVESRTRAERKPKLIVNGQDS